MYSPNLGDGVIAECFSHAAGRRPRWLDLAGRSDFSAPRGGARTAVLHGLDAVPGPVSELLAEQLVRAQIARRLAPRFDATFAGAGGLILGGGQLLADAHMNFPVKLASTATAARRRGLPVALHGVGVSARWSPRARDLFATLFAPGLATCCVRDPTSRDALTRHLRAARIPVPEIVVAPDPGFLAARCEPAGTMSRKRIGLGITHPAPLRAHGGVAVPGTRVLAARYAELAARMVAGGAAVTLFTNGAGEDEAMLAQVLAALPAGLAGHSVQRAARAPTPRALMRLIAGFQALVSHRMHGNIIAFSYGVPCVGLGWDPKMAACFEMMERPGALHDGTLSTPAALARFVLAEAASGPLPAAPRAALAASAAEGIAQSLAAMDTARSEAGAVATGAVYG